MSPLAQFTQEKLQHKSILAMTHVVYGYPTVEESLAWMKRLLQEGVDFIEVQFPFSDPVADGPSIVAACHQALKQDLDVDTCLTQLGALAKDFPDSRIVLMSYLNPMYRFGLQKLAERAAEEQISGLILPDLPIEAARNYQQACQNAGIDPIWLVTPVTPKGRLAMLAEQAQGFLYCVARSGVTGQSNHQGKTPSTELESYLAEIKQHTNTPLGVGFGLRNKEQINALVGKAEIAILGSALLDAYNQGGQEAGVKLIKTLFD